jgi:excisionase family DNA binding protein
MHHRQQFDVRENPASDPRHGSRQLVHSFSDDDCVPKQIATASSRDDGNGASPHAAIGGGERHLIQADPSAPAALISAENGSAFESLISSSQAAKLLGNLHIKTLQRYARLGRLPGYQIGRHWYFRESELDAWLRLQLNSKCQSVR